MPPECTVGQSPGQETRAAPVPARERLVALDAARGAAILGLSLVNIRHFAFPFAGELYPPLRPRFSGDDAFAFYVVKLFVEFKFLSLLALLFGAGLALRERRWAKAEAFESFYRRWLLVLGVLGVLHGTLLWFGDILSLYALAGWAALRLRKRHVANLTLLALALLLGGGVAVAAAILAQGLGYAARVSSLIQEQTWIYSKGSWVQVASFGSRLFAILLTVNPIALGPRVLGLFLLGVVMVRRSWLDRVRRGGGRVLGGAAAAFLAGLALEWLGVWAEVKGTRASLALAWLGHYSGGLGMAFAYFVWLIRLGGSRRWGWAARTLAAVGRMALTNYLFQSAACAAVFFPYGFGLFGLVPLSRCYSLVFLLMALQASGSVLWLRFFSFGPMEWLARGLSYGSWPPLRRRP